MIDWRPHKLWIGLLGLALAIALGHATVLSIAQKKAEKRLSSLRQENEKTVKALQQLEGDIAESERMRTEIDVSEAERYLAPADRFQTAQTLERLAADSRLTRFSYSFSPEQRKSVETLTGGAQEVSESRWSLAADAPTDIEAFAFLDEMMAQLQGSVMIRELSLDRVGAKDAPIANVNIRLTASGDWVSNGAVQNPAKGAR